MIDYILYAVGLAVVLGSRDIPDEGWGRLAGPVVFGVGGVILWQGLK